MAHWQSVTSGCHCQGADNSLLYFVRVVNYVAYIRCSTALPFDHIYVLYTSLCLFTDITKNDQPSNQSAGTTTTPTENKCDMKTMYKCVVSKLAPYWTTVGDYLEYSVHERNTFKGPDDKKSLVVMLENWIGTDNGRQPKTWSTFIRILMMLDQDLSISVGSEIRARLERELSSSVSSSSGKLLYTVYVHNITRLIKNLKFKW